MADYLTWLIFIALGVLAFTTVQLKESRYRRLIKDYQVLEAKYSTMHEDWKRVEFRRLQLEGCLIESKKCKDLLNGIRSDLKSAKMAPDYLSARRLEYLEDYVAASVLADDPDLVFLETFDLPEVRTLKKRLVEMLDEAEFEIEIISPWIKRQTWECIQASLARFMRKGGSLRVFMRNEESDSSKSPGDDIRKDVDIIGGEVILIKQLHAKLYLVDRKEAILTSANLTRGGLDCNIEAGIWSNNPFLVREMGKFVDDLYSKSKV